MPTLIEELSELSDNRALFAYLRTGGELTALPESAAQFPKKPKTRKPELLAFVREALVPALQTGDLSRLEAIIANAGTNTRVTLVGELILTLYALADGTHANEKEKPIWKTAVNLSLELASALEAQQPQDTNDAELLAHGIAMREWAHLFAVYCKAKGIPAYEAELLMIRARATNSTLSSWAHLVGAAMIDIALALEPIGNVEMAKRCYHGVRMDLRYLLTRADVYPEFETGCALYWLQRACENRIRLVPDDADAAADLERVRKTRESRRDPALVAEPRFGPIAQTYLDRIPYLARIIHDINTGYDKEHEDESIAAICRRYGCLSTEVEFYVSAIGSYHLRKSGILGGVHMLYDEPHQEVFAALDYREPKSD